MNFKILKNFLDDEQGAELAEYAVAVALLVAVALVVYKVLGTAINDREQRYWRENRISYNLCTVISPARCFRTWIYRRRSLNALNRWSG